MLGIDRSLDQGIELVSTFVMCIKFADCILVF